MKTTNLMVLPFTLFTQSISMSIFTLCTDDQTQQNYVSMYLYIVNLTRLFAAVQYVKQKNDKGSGLVRFGLVWRGLARFAISLLMKCLKSSSLAWIDFYSNQILTRRYRFPILRPRGRHNIAQFSANLLFRWVKGLVFLQCSGF